MKFIHILTESSDGNGDNKIKDKNSNINILINDTFYLVVKFSNERGYDNFRLINDPNLQNTITSIITYKLLK